MKRSGLVFPLSVWLLCGACASNSFTGSQHAVILRSDAELKTYGSYSIVLASDWKSHRLRGMPLSRAEVDVKQAALRFTLPTPEHLTADQPLCLVIVGPRGPLPVRPRASGPEQYEFRNPVWEEELRRLAALRRAEHEARQRHADEQATRGRMDTALRALDSDGLAARTPGECREGEPGPVPERPPDALAEPERGPAAALLCALVWEGAVGPGVGKLYGEVGGAQVWVNRQREAARLQRLPVRLSVPNLIPLAVRQGRQLIEYDEAVAAFRQITGQCEKEVATRFAEETEQWELQVAEVRAAPRRAFERCRERTASYQEARLKHIGAQTALQQAESAVERLRAQAPKSVETTSLASFTCP